MLITRAILDRIVAGEIDLAFRRWKRPTVKAGGQLRTSVGMLDVRSVERVAVSALTAADAARAGFETRKALLAELGRRSEGDVYRIELSFAGADPRIALRENADLSADELDDVLVRLERMDDRSARGPWTLTVLELLEANPHTRAPDLAAGLGLETKVFKNDVRKLKGLGLTISHSPGYELSPRGEVVLDAWRLRCSRGNEERQ